MLLWPISIAYCAAVEVRRLAYRAGLLRSTRIDKPVIVIGNITVGGSGKTPLTIWLANHLQDLGYSPGIVSRGYGRDTDAALRAYPGSKPHEVGDEPVLLSRSTDAPVAVARNRAEALGLLEAETDCDIFVSDDGLQHLALEHDLSIAMLDDARGMGNSFCLPAGPLRERKALLERVDFLVSRDSRCGNAYAIRAMPTDARNLCETHHTRNLESFCRDPVVAIAGIRNPQRFFSTLQQLGIDCDTHEFPDHHVFCERDFSVFDHPGVSVLMTEKDAVKCEAFARPNWWAVGMRVDPDPEFVAALSARVAQLAPLRGENA